MYNLSPRIKGHWDRFFGWLAREAGVALDIIAHAPPAPLSELWERPDLGAAFMCGYPYSMVEPEARPVALAAPVPAAEWANGKPVYASHVIAALGSPLGPNDLPKARWGWTVRDSQSGYNAPRGLLVELGATANPPGAVGPLLNPRGILDAVTSGRVEVGAIDAYAWQLLALHEPEALATVRIVATTPAAPFPLLIAARATAKEAVIALRSALTNAGDGDAGRSVLQPLGLTGFAVPDLAAYDTLPDRARAADLALGGPW